MNHLQKQELQTLFSVMMVKQSNIPAFWVVFCQQ